jgi:hypothetical protein
MNKDTRIVVFGYAGDQQQIEQLLPFYLHHQCPIVILSPEDSKVEINHPGVENRFAGKRAQCGPDALARFLEHLKILLTFPENHFFMHESDSICFDPKIPAYLYAEPDTVWSNSGEAQPRHQHGFVDGCPKLSFQAPWFLSRKTIEALIAVADKAGFPDLPWVDLYLVHLTHAAGLPYKRFFNCYLGPVSGRSDNTNALFDPGGSTKETDGGSVFKGEPLTPQLIDFYKAGFKVALEYVKNGANMLHSVKNPIAAQELQRAYVPMNSDTRIAVCCYAGDGNQVGGALPFLWHHKCPITILSPDDQPFTIDHPMIDNRCGGKRAYTGQLSLDRQWEQLKILLTYPEDFFLIHDADSICLSPKIPDYLYAEDVLWSNLVHDNMRERAQGFYMDGFPRIAFQPPYFLSRRTLKKLLAPVMEKNLDMNPTLPFIDHYMVQLAVKAGVPWKDFTDGFTGPISSDYSSFVRAWTAVQRGAVLIHSIKAPAFGQSLMLARANYLAGKRTAAPPMPISAMHWSREQSQTRSLQMRDEAQIARARSSQSRQSQQHEQLNSSAQRLMMTQRRALIYGRTRGKA